MLKIKKSLFFLLLGVFILRGSALSAILVKRNHAQSASYEAITQNIFKLSQTAGGSSGFAGGLCVHAGCGDGRFTISLFKSGGGRFLVHGIDNNENNVELARRLIQKQGLYGPVCVKHHSTLRLPFAENIVNLLVVDNLQAVSVSPDEIMRVLCPGGIAWLGQSGETAPGKKRIPAHTLEEELHTVNAVIIRLEAGESWLKIEKPWPPGIDQWTHPRHGSDGNAASSDTLVGPPRRVRWIAGPLHEASNMITSGGKLFHGGLIARDAFNGIRLWDRKISPTPLRLGYPFTAVPGSVLPVASGNHLYAVSNNKLVEIDSTTGKTLRTYPEAKIPRKILYINGTIITVDHESVKAIDSKSGKLRWSYKTSNPGCVVSGDKKVFLLEGNTHRGEKRALVCLSLLQAKIIWRKDSLKWAARIRKLSYHEKILVCEASTLNNTRPGNSIFVISGRDGKLLWHLDYEPSMSHYMQARAVHAGGLLWIQHNGKWEGYDPETGKKKESFVAGKGHCYPPVGTGRFLIAGEMSFTDLATGSIDSNRITKGFCGRDAGFIPANGLLYCAPKHCSCWPMLQGYVAMAGANKDGKSSSKSLETPVLETSPSLETSSLEKLQHKGIKEKTRDSTSCESGSEWPCYRADPWRSGSTPGKVDADLQILWKKKLATWPDCRFLQDWKEDLFVRGLLTSPVAAGEFVVVAIPDRHKVIALDAFSGKSAWSFTANGRVDSPPTIFKGLCLFGTRSGWLYCLRLSGGTLAWRRRIAPTDKNIVCFSQLESPWPVPGSVLILNDTAYIAAGRQPLADGGVIVMALDPLTGKIKWQKHINSLPMQDFYLGAGLEFDCFDLLNAECSKPNDPASKRFKEKAVDFITMSRWRFDPATGDSNVVWKSGFGFYKTGGTGVMAPRGIWTYGPRMDYIPSGPAPGKPDYVRTSRRPLMTFRGNTLIGSNDAKDSLFRKDFSPGQIAAFNDKWYSQRLVPRGRDRKGDKNRSQHLAHNASWTTNVFPRGSADREKIGALIRAGDIVFVAGTRGHLIALSIGDGKKLSSTLLPAPIWDGMSAAYGQLYVSTRAGELICLGKK